MKKLSFNDGIRLAASVAGLLIATAILLNVASIAMLAAISTLIIFQFTKSR